MLRTTRPVVELGAQVAASADCGGRVMPVVIALNDLLLAVPSAPKKLRRPPSAFASPGLHSTGEPCAHSANAADSTTTIRHQLNFPVDYKTRYGSLLAGGRTPLATYCRIASRTPRSNYFASSPRNGRATVPFAWSARHQICRFQRVLDQPGSGRPARSIAASRSTVGAPSISAPIWRPIRR